MKKKTIVIYGLLACVVPMVSFAQTSALLPTFEWKNTQSIQNQTIIDADILRTNLEWLYERSWLGDSKWSLVGSGPNASLTTPYNVEVDGALRVGGTVTASDPTGDGNVVTLGYLKRLLTEVYGYRDFGNMRDAQNVPQVNYSRMREFYSPDQATANYLCSAMGYDKGSWTRTGSSGGSGWNYHNLSIVTYEPNKGFTNGYANAGQRFTCFGRSCSSNRQPYISNLRCLAQADNKLYDTVIPQQVLRDSQIPGFDPRVSTVSVGTTKWSACKYKKRSDKNNYYTNRTVKCYDEATNSYVAANKCYGKPASSWKVFGTKAICDAFVARENIKTPHRLK